MSWKEASILLPQNTPASPADYHNCWATDGATRDGSYYFFLSIGPQAVAVLNSTTPVGPWDNALGVPLLSASLGQHLVRGCARGCGCVRFCP